MSISMSQINSIINKKIEENQIENISSNIKNWKELKKEYPEIYKDQVDKIFDELHPY